jgi:starch synthase
MKILFVASECSPFAKTGGLGDVVGSLPPYLKNLSHDVRIVIPLYSFIDREKFRIIESIEHMTVWMGNEVINCSVYKSKISEDVPVYFIGYAPFFDRTGIYHDTNFNDYLDNPKRFSFLSMAALQLCRELEFKPDVIHAHDWHTAVITAYIKKLVKDDPLFDGTASVLTIHNLAYQGRYAWYFWEFTGLSWDDFKQDRFEDYTAINFLKGGIFYADMVNTVSRGYADETRTPEAGFGLDFFLNKKGINYVGILNGVDYSHWDPAKDPLIPVQYTPGNLEGKWVCKNHLQQFFQLKQDKNIPVIGIISRLVEQKGFYILGQCMENILNDFNVQFAVLGSGDKLLENLFKNLSARFTGKLGVYIGYSNDLAHQIEAGSDFFLMPSLYEPCGLNQIYSLKYGTLPIVRATGGLKETVENYNQQTGEGTGFKFHDASGPAIYGTVKWALDTYFNRKPHMEKLIQNAMKQHFSWDQSAMEYVHMYHRALENLKI